MTAAIDPGNVTLTLTVAEQRVISVQVACRRPALAGRLHGQPAERAVAAIPLLFSICGRAQGLAAHLALRAARGQAAPPEHHPEIAHEIIGEHLWRLLLDWPRVLDLPTEQALFMEARRRLAEPNFADWADAKLAPAVNRVLSALAGRPEPDGGIPLLPPLDATDSLNEWPSLDDAFAARPTWRDRAAETGALARNCQIDHSRPLRSRVRARWLEVLSPPGTASAVAIAPGVGRALVDTARGLLMHEIRLADDRIAEYTIVAPTEWNFHDEGNLRQWLTNCRLATAEGLAERALLALDACVPTRIQIVY